MDYIDCFRAGLREDDPPANVPPMKVQLKPGAHPVHARPRQAAPEKETFLRSITKTKLVKAGMVVSAFGAVFASPTMAMLKPSSVREQVKPSMLPVASAGGSSSEMGAKVSSSTADGTRDYDGRR